MARAATTSDIFNAVAESRRREILDFLSKGESSVSSVVEALSLEQPMVSKHLKVLKEVGLVKVRLDGRQRIYSLNAVALKPLYDWASGYERFWSQHLRRVKLAAEAKSKKKKIS